MDIAVTQDKDGRQLVAHRLDCAVVMQHRVQSKPIMTMFGCENPLPGDLKKCDCMERIAR